MVLHRDSTQPAEDPGNEVAVPAIASPEPPPAATQWPSDDASQLAEILQSHGLTVKLVEKLVGFATAPTHVKRPVDRLAIALGSHFNFFALDEAWQAPILLCGLAGAGTSTITAKLVARFDKSEVLVIAAGTHGAVKLEELRDNLETLDLPLMHARDTVALRQAVASADGRKIVIDMGGSSSLDRKQIQEFASAAGAIGMLVTSAEASHDATRAAAETANALGFTRMIVTHLDAARYLGAALNAADTAKLALVSASITPHFGFGLRALSPENLARRLMSAAAHPERWRASPL
jgi:signal recognition particle GTPase